MPVYFAPDIPFHKLHEALDAIRGCDGLLTQKSIFIVVEAPGNSWCIATPDGIFFSPATVLKKEEINDVSVKGATGIEFFSNNRYGWLIPHAAFERVGDTQETWRRLRKAYLAKEAVASQPMRLNTTLEVTEYDPDSHSYWIRPNLEDGQVANEVEWFAVFPFEEHPICARISLCNVKIVGAPQVVQKFLSEPTMARTLSPFFLIRDKFVVMLRVRAEYLSAISKLEEFSW